MDSFKNDELEILIISKENCVDIVWKGRSEMREPGAVLNPYFSGLIDELEGKEVRVDFTLLEYMNSSTALPIINLIKSFERKKIRSSILYDKNNKWQVSSFKTLEILSSMINKVKPEKT